MTTTPLAQIIRTTQTTEERRANARVPLDEADQPAGPR